MHNMADMNNFSNKKKGNYPRKSDRELESFLPESMRTPAKYSGTLPTNNQHQRKNQYNNEFVRSGGGYGRNNQYNIYPDEPSQGYGSKRGREKRGDSQAWADKYYDEDKDSSSNYVESHVASGAGRRGVLSIIGNETNKNEKASRPTNNYSSDTFHVQSSGIRTSKPTPTKVVIARHTSTAVEKKEPEQRMTILKPTGQLSTNTPVILSRANADTSTVRVVPKSSSMAVLSNSNANVPTSNGSYKIATKPTLRPGPDLKIVAEKVMTSRPFRLIDDDFNLCEGSTALNSYLLEQSNFLVVGVVGRQGAGKSSVAAMLAGQSPLQGQTKDSCSFRLAGATQITRCSQTTTGLDVFVTSQRVLVLDFPAMLGTGVMDATTGRGTDPKHAALYQSVPLELQVYSKALQFLSLALRVCHAVVVVQDDLPQSTEMLRCLQVATVMTKANCPEQGVASTKLPEAGFSMRGFYTGDEEKRSPSVLVLHNKAGPTADMTPSRLRAIQTHLSRQLTGCEVDYRTGLGASKGGRGGVNLFFMPQYSDYNTDNDAQRCATALRRAVAGIRRRPFTGYASCTERQWFEYTVREFEKIRKSSLYLDYSRLFP